jgi:asparagine synthase (glutamine-hydrolysing)
MCGIAGFFLPRKRAAAADVRRMCERIRHRGPDDEGVYTDGGCGIGMRRLSIIDLNTGRQPISNEDGSVWIVYNGEVYNYRELRENLIAQGHRFSTNSDTETIVHLHEQEGVEGIAKLRGMFAYAIWDAARSRLTLARDRFGKKPLYYAITGNGIYFASEMKCLRDFPIPWDLDEDALKLYFQFGYLPDPATPFRAIRKLMPGCWLEYDERGARHGRYWKLPTPAERPPVNMTRERMRVAVREKFDEAVRIRMIADVPLGAFLSGGIDSSSVVASMALQSSAPVKTFSIGFDEAEFNELDYARAIARKYKTEHHEIVVRPDSVNLVSRLVQHFDEPFADSSAIPTYILSQFAVQHVKVALSGDGGDELFAGYKSFFRLGELRKFDALPQPLRRMAGWVSGLLPYSAYGKNYLRMISRPSPMERYFEVNGTPYFLRRQLLEPEWMLPDDGEFLSGRLADFLPSGSANALTQALYFETTAKLAGDILVKVDRMSMANSLEVRSPLLDHELAELSATIPHEWKISNGTGKAILLEAIGDRLPPELLRRPKMGFGVPLASWLRGPLREFLSDHLTAGESVKHHILSPAFVRYLVDEHQARRRDNSSRLWGLLMLELWLREWKAEAQAQVDPVPLQAI